MRPSTFFRALALLALIPLALHDAHAQNDDATLAKRVQALERAGRFAEAVPLYEEWQRLSPNQAPIIRGHARALSAIGAHQRVITLLDAWLKKRRDSPAALLLGDAYHALEDDNKAVASWRLAIDKASAASYGPVADRCRVAGLRQQAIRILREGQKAHGGESISGLYTWELAALYLEEGDYRPSFEMFIANIERVPQRLPIVAGRLEIVCRTQGTKALQTLQALSSERPLFVAQLIASCALAAGDPESGLTALDGPAGQDVEHLFQYAARAEAMGYTETAARAYALFSERRPDSPYRYQALSRQAALTAREDSNTALELYRRLARDFPDRPETLQTLVGIARLQLEQNGDIEEAISSLQSVIDSPRRGEWTPQALVLLAESSLRLGDFNRSERALDALEKLGPNAYEARFRRAELFYFRGNFAVAETLLVELSTTNPGHHLANDVFDLLLLCEDHSNSPGLATLGSAQLLERQGKSNKAREQWIWLEENAEPALAERSLLTRARLREQEGHIAQALSLYERQASRFPDGEYIVSAQLHRAGLYERRGDRQQALNTYETTLLQHPDDALIPEIRLRIQRLRRSHESD